MGIRLDGGTAYSGGVITRYYDSLLVKVTAWAPTPEKAISRMDRALREFRIRGVSTNIAFVENLLKHPIFLNYEYTTKFIDTSTDLFEFSKRRDRGTKVLNYIKAKKLIITTIISEFIIFNLFFSLSPFKITNFSLIQLFVLPFTSGVVYVHIFLKIFFLQEYFLIV